MKPLIYIIDDSETYRLLYEQLFVERLPGYDYRIFASYEECLLRAAADNPRVVICDLVMGGMSGWEGIHELQKVLPKARLIVATCLDTEIQKEAAGIEGLEFWPKSHLLSELQNLIRGVCNGDKP